MRVLFLTSTRIGDAILSTGAYRYVVERWPAARVTVACGPDAAGIFEAAPNLEAIIPMAKRRRAGHWVDLWRRCAPKFWSVIVDGRRSAVARLLAHRRLYVLGVKQPGVHTVEQWTRAVGAPAPLEPCLWTSATHDAEADALLRASAAGPVLALAPTANWIGKQWMADRFVEVVRRLTGPAGVLPGARVAVFSAPAERGAALAVSSALEPDRLVDLAGRTDLLTAYACLRQADLFIGNDSALMHLAAASGVPTVGLFGPSREENYGPWGARTAVARADLSYDEILATPGYDHKKPISWMDSLRVETVVTAAEGLLSDDRRLAAE